MNRLSLFSFALLFFSLSLNGQPHQNCDDPLVLCGSAPFTLDGPTGFGLDEFVDQGYCLPSEGSSVWIELNISDWGYLTFVLTPLQSQDLDFMVFKMDDSGCQGKTLVRCMASGESIGSPSDPCIGKTGLAMNNFDTIEEVGCDPGDNNFLAPLDADTGDRFLLVVMDFSQSGGAFMLDFGGSARLDCIDFNPISDLNEIDFSSQVDAYFSNENNHLNIDVLASNFQGAQLVIYSHLGQKVYAQNDLRMGLNQISLNSVAPGKYVYIVRNDHHEMVRNFSKIH